MNEAGLQENGSVAVGEIEAEILARPDNWLGPVARCVYGPESQAVLTRAQCQRLLDVFRAYTALADEGLAIIGKFQKSLTAAERRLRKKIENAED